MTEMDAWISIGTFARKAGVSVRALRFYEEQGLLSPVRDRGNGRRCFRESDLITMQNILLLKEIGLSLRDIRLLLSSATPDLEAVLNLQLDLLIEQRRVLEHTIQSVQQAVSQLGAGDRPDLDALCRLIRMTRMRTQMSEELYRKYLTPDQMAALSALGSARAGEDDLQAWLPLFDEAAKLVGSDPTAAPAQEFAGRWWALLEESTGGDMDLIMNLKSMYDDMESWPEGLDRPFSPEIRDFMNAAITHLLESRKAD